MKILYIIAFITFLLFDLMLVIKFREEYLLILLLISIVSMIITGYLVEKGLISK